MAQAFLTLESVSYVLPDGNTLFSNLSEQFDLRHTGLVGRNGVGKSVLARILARQITPSAGRSVCSGRVHYLAQQISTFEHVSVSVLAGIHHVIDALERIEAGSSDPADFDQVADQWNIRDKLQLELEQNGLGHLTPHTPAHRLSGGEAMRVALIGARLANPDFLILDEPSNHLDRAHRRALIEYLQRWSGGLIVISHDRELLQTMSRIVELSTSGLRSYGGNYLFYRQTKNQENTSAIAQLERLKHERKREQQLLREKRERQQQRQSQGHKEARTANQAKILLGGQKNRSEASAGRLQRQQAQQLEALAEKVHDAAQQVDRSAQIVMHLEQAEHASRRLIAELREVELPFVQPHLKKIDLTLSSRQRVALIGNNGCGKSTLLKVLAGQMEPLSGHRAVLVQSAYLDQQLSLLNPDRSVIEQLLQVNHLAGEALLRMQLAQLGLNARHITVPSRLLSGGERLKATLACAIYAHPAPQLLLLDEPSNHLDLETLEALEGLLQQYPGALLVVSHDEEFLHRIRLSERLEATPQGWRLDAW